ncbi:nitrogen assimilation transcription factor nirA [Paecilomyces variotii No. 5]|uniref:Nitrogen assimilation transcription factor nirA n=1 Tax=Byssochlamys spectabilis (strain No. 5 / NBRC 109023) TaxID=1356009 RepID=V5FJR3_BYSSN|nr:nitrogen assimilation transcription factor nirA [Paecilomyces variotii No. 5]
MVRACQFCRRRKIKCDTIKPACTPCRNGNRSCIYDSGPHKQRPSAAIINKLRGEKLVLEEVLGRLKAADDGQRQVLLDSLDLRDRRKAVNFENRSPALATRERNTNNDDSEALEIMDEYNDDGQSSDEEELPYDTTVQHELVAQKDDHTGDTLFNSTSIVRTTSPTRGEVNVAREAHKQPEATVFLQSLRNQLIANGAIERQREHRLRYQTTIRGVPAELAMHLLDLHWSRQHHTFLLSYRPAFMRELVDGGPYCTDLLLYAVFACSSKFSERLEVRSDPANPETAGHYFFTRCDDLLLREGLLSQSRIPTTIALLMLGSTFIARGMTSKGWLYTGYALRMVYDLGLHIDRQDVQSHNAEEVEIRRRVFWGAFICDKLQSLYLGRPPTIRVRDARVSRDFMDAFEELEPWEPYQDPTTDCANIKIPAGSMASTYTYSVTVFQQLCLLSIIMTRIINKIYFVGATATKTLNEIRPLDDALTSWYRDLPQYLAFEPWTKGSMDPPVIVAPNRIILLTTYHSLVILLHRPFVSRQGDETTYSVNSVNSWKRCTTAARNITSLAVSYRSIYPLRKSNYLLSYAVYVACTIHVLNAASKSASYESHGYGEASLLLSASLRCLDELAVPNSGVADTARIIRKIMAAKGVAESPTPAEFQELAPRDMFDNILQAFNTSPTCDDFSQIQLFDDLTISGQDLLFGFMTENTASEQQLLSTMAQDTTCNIGVLSIGDMGLGLSKLLISQGERTRDRARSNAVELLPSLREFVETSDCVLSIVPPRDAYGTAQRVSDVANNGSQSRERPLYYLDLNAISPGLSAKIDELFKNNDNVVLIDGGIIGGVPYPKASSPTGWNCPSLIVSGPTELPYQGLARILNIDHISSQIGAASGLKMCFGSTTKGFFALAIQSFVTADALGILPELRQYMQRYNAETLSIVDRGVVSMPPKAYRWVHEMQEIGAMMQEDGGFDKALFDNVAEVYRVVAEDTELGQEQPGNRKRGTTTDDVVKLMRSGMKAARKDA